MSSDGRPGSIFSSFSPASRATMATARAEAIEAGDNFIGTEHLLLALLRDEDGPGAKVFAELGVRAAQLREDTKAALEPYHVPRGPKREPAVAPVPRVLTPNATWVLRVATRKAQLHRMLSVEPEHLALALVEVEEGMAQRVLAPYHIEIAEAREVVRRQTGAPLPPHAGGPGGVGRSRVTPD